MDFRITLLGTSSGVPTRQRNVTSIAMQLLRDSSLWLFDCGEATQHQILKYPSIKLSKLNKIFITHMHGDHIYGLLGLLSTINLNNLVTNVDIYGPPKLKAFILHALEMSSCHLRYHCIFHTVQPGIIYEDNAYQVHCDLLDHRITAYGYKVVRKSLPGKFDIEKARTDAIPEGPLYQLLKNKKTVTLDDGRVVEGVKYVGNDIPEKIITYCSDTIYCQNAIKLAENANLLIHEATYLNSEFKNAHENQHSTVEMAASVAKEAHAKQLLLTHFSSRYESDPKKFNALAVSEAQAVFSNVLLGYDGFMIEI